MVSVADASITFSRLDGNFSNKIITNEEIENTHEIQKFRKEMEILHSNHRTVTHSAHFIFYTNCLWQLFIPIVNIFSKYKQVTTTTHMQTRIQ